jgi:hypothetical protein
MLTADDWKALQDTHVEAAKKILLEDGHLRMLAFVCTSMDSVRSAKLGTSATLKDMETMEPIVSSANSDGLPNGMGMIGVPMESNEAMLDMVLALWPDRAYIMHLAVRAGRELGLEEQEVYEKAMNAWFKATKVDEKDLACRYVRWLAEKVDAHAVMHVSEAWMAKSVTNMEYRAYKADPKKHSLEHDTKSIESIKVSIDTHEFRRLVMVPFEREPPAKGAARDSGKVVSFGEPEIITTEGQGLELLAGRMIAFLARPGDVVPFERSVKP